MHCNSSPSKQRAKVPLRQCEVKSQKQISSIILFCHSTRASRRSIRSEFILAVFFDKYHLRSHTHSSFNFIFYVHKSTTKILRFVSGQCLKQIEDLVGDDASTLLVASTLLPLNGPCWALFWRKSEGSPNGPASTVINSIIITIVQLFSRTKF